MGQAVTDAAAWYDKADWIGVHTTPRTNLVINRYLEHEEKSKENVMLDYDVPLKNGSVLYTKAVNWPKVFFVESIRPCEAGGEKEKLLDFSRGIRFPGVRNVSFLIQSRSSIILFSR